MADGEIREHMEIIGSDGGHVGTVDRLEHGHIRLTRTDDPAGLGGHRAIPLSAIAEVEAGRVRLTLPAQQARAMAAGGGRPDRMEEGFRSTGDAAATDPVCRYSPRHDTVVAAREQAQTDEFVYRTMKRPARRPARVAR